ncbi:uncharacterized protein CG3556-like [Pollicipes pollicipes]|uniref:uncharacterized protein CG3556-like n=1 Tax=Pollicipes pollicipes TaxID=41117 RepID=UPI001884980F|nr:uncharacterized protein CG3556-like [Pollicipes pollicipes]
MKLVILLSLACLASSFKQEEPAEVPAAAAAAASSGLRWLMGQQEPDRGWGVDTARAVMAAALVNDSALAGPDRQLTRQQLEINALADLWRHHDYPLTAARLAEYLLALVSLCGDVRHFHGRDLTAVLQHQRDPLDYESALVVLATCAAGAPVRRRSFGRLLAITSASGSLHGTDTLALSVLALRCVADNENKHVDRHLGTPLATLVARQEADGSFGNFHSTLLAIQALRSEGVAAGWSWARAVSYLLSRQQSDGSFGDVRDTAEVLPTLAGRSLLAVADLPCHRQRGDAAALAGADEHEPRPAKELPSIDRSVNSSLASAPRLMNVTLWLWIGVDVSQSFSCRLAVPENTSLFDCMKLAAERDSRFQFSAEAWPNGHYVHTIAGRHERADGYHFWLLYRLAGRPDPARPPTGRQLFTAGVDNLYPNEDEHVLFWYKDL